MRHILIVLGMCVAAIIIGLALYVYGPAELNEAAVLTDTPAAAVTAEPLEDISFAVIGEGPNAAEVTERKNYAVYDEAEFSRIWEMAYGSDGAPPPTIDFSTEYVIAVFAGMRSTGGHAIHVSQIADSSTERTVMIELVRPGSSCVVSQAFTSPFQLIRVPMSALAPSRVEKEVIRECE